MTNPRVRVDAGVRQPDEVPDDYSLLDEWTTSDDVKVEQWGHRADRRGVLVVIGQRGIDGIGSVEQAGLADMTVDWRPSLVEQYGQAWLNAQRAKASAKYASAWGVPR